MQTVTLKNNIRVIIRLLQAEDERKLAAYFNGLSQETKMRFGPHSFDTDTIHQISTQLATDETQRYIAETIDSRSLIAYMLIKTGVLINDASRLASYGISISHTDCTFAPSIADAYQSCGLGNAMFRYIIGYLPGRRMILWGGVQASNEKALQYYNKLGFYKVGTFNDHNGGNFDMIREPNR